MEMRLDEGGWAQPPWRNMDEKIGTYRAAHSPGAVSARRKYWAGMNAHVWMNASRSGPSVTS